MSAPKERNLLALIFNNFIKSLKRKEPFGTFKGEDHLGHKYYEIGYNTRTGSNKPTRWFECEDDNKLEHELPVEWDSWLRFRRSDPPTPEEISQNTALIELKKKNAAKLAEERGETISSDRHNLQNTSFPRYNEFELWPGQKKKESH